MSDTSLTDALWSQVLGVTLYRDAGGRLLHTTSQGRDDTLTDPEEVSIKDVGVRDVRRDLCTEWPCRRDLTSTNLVLISKTLNQLQELKDAQDGVTTGTRSLRYLKETHESITQERHLVGRLVQATYEETLEVLRTEWDKTLAVLRTDAHQQEVHADYQRWLSVSQENEIIGRGHEVTDMGLLVGARAADTYDLEADEYGRARTNPRTTLVLIYGKTHPSGRLTLRAPLGTLVHLTGMSRRKYAAGWKSWQIIPLAEDLTPELEEVLVGVYDPDGDGPLADLHQALRCAHELLDT